MWFHSCQLVEVQVKRDCKPSHHSRYQVVTEMTWAKVAASLAAASCKSHGRIRSRFFASQFFFFLLMTMAELKFLPLGFGAPKATYDGAEDRIPQHELKQTTHPEEVWHHAS